MEYLVYGIFGLLMWVRRTDQLHSGMVSILFVSCNKPQCVISYLQVVGCKMF